MHAALKSRHLIHNLYHKKMGVRPFKILLFFMKVKSEQNPWKELTSVAVANSKSAKTIGIPSSLHRNILSSPRPFAFFCVFSFFFYSSNFSNSSRLHTHTHAHTHTTLFYLRHGVSVSNKSKCIQHLKKKEKKQNKKTTTTKR